MSIYSMRDNYKKTCLVHLPDGHGDAHDENEKRKDKISKTHAIPFSMIQEMKSASAPVHKDHREHRQTIEQN